MADEAARTIILNDFDKNNMPPRPEGNLSSAEVERNIRQKRAGLQAQYEALCQEVNNLNDKIQNAAPEKKSELLKEISEISRKKMEINREMVQIDNQHKMYEKNPSEYTNLYNAGENVAGDDGVKKQISDENGSLGLVVEMMRPSPFGFTIRDGRLTFDNTDISPEQLKEMLEVLDKMGIKDIQIPEELDKRLKDNLGQAMDDREKAENAGYDKNRALSLMEEGEPPAEENRETQSRGEENASAPSEQPVIPGVNPSYNPAEPANLPDPKEKAKYPYDYKELKHKIGFDILQRNMGKVEGLSSFHVRQGGWDKWYVYDTQNPNNYENDGKRDKDGNVSVKNAFVIWAKENKNGSISLGYSMPNGKPISNALADKLISLHKDRGATHIKFKDMTDDDAGTFRTRCARLGIIPVGIGINEKHAQEMISEASKKLSDTELQTYKWRLAQQMRANIRAAGKSFESDRSAGYIKELEGDFKFNPFKGAYDDVFKGIIEREKRSRKAENAIGAVNTMDKIFEAYRGGMETDDPGAITMGEVLNPKNNLFTEEEINAIKSKYAENGMTLPLDKPMNEITKEDFSAMFEAVLPIQQKQAEQELREETGRYTSAKEKDDAVRDAIDDANLKMDRISGELEQKGMKKMYFARINRSMKFGGRLENDENTQTGQRSQTAQPKAQNRQQAAQAYNRAQNSR